MTPKRFEQVIGIYQGAAELNAAQQTDFLTPACGEDASLLQEVKSLLAPMPPPADSFEQTRRQRAPQRPDSTRAFTSEYLQGAESVAITLICFWEPAAWARSTWQQIRGWAAR